MHDGSAGCRHREPAVCAAGLPGAADFERTYAGARRVEEEEVVVWKRRRRLPPPRDSYRSYCLDRAVHIAPYPPLPQSGPCDEGGFGIFSAVTLLCQWCSLAPGGPAAKAERRQ